MAVGRATLTIIGSTLKTIPIKLRPFIYVRIVKGCFWLGRFRGGGGCLCEGRGLGLGLGLGLFGGAGLGGGLDASG